MNRINRIKQQPSSFDDELTKLVGCVDTWTKRVAQVLIQEQPEGMDLEEYIKQVVARSPDYTPEFIRFLLSKDPQQWDDAELDRARKTLISHLSPQRN